MTQSQLDILQLDQEKEAHIERLFHLQSACQQNMADTNAAERKKRLQRLYDAVLRYRPKIEEALHLDFRRHPSETALGDIYPLATDIRHVKRHLKHWMRPQKVANPIAMMGARSYIHYEPMGVVLIISPWNYPLQLTFGPLVSAIAAGNCAIVKPSELTRHTSQVIEEIVEDVFDHSEVAVVQGGPEVSQKLLALPFNHVAFTGSPQVGKIVMGAAAKNLTSVTLELGGKSPTIIDETANIDDAALKTVWGKFMNNGQTCIAPDYVYVHNSVKKRFVASVKQQLEKFYGDNEFLWAKSPSYCRLINQKHFYRLTELLEDAQRDGAEIEIGGQLAEADAYMAPTVLTEVKDKSRIMHEEIFGPLLPIIGFDSLEEPLQTINNREKPLALYIYSKSRKNIDHIIHNTRAGGTCINDNIIHFLNSYLPFGGSNNSGIGKNHGIYGFRSFSNARAVLDQRNPLSAIKMMMPPYNSLKQKLIDFSIKYF